MATAEEVLQTMAEVPESAPVCVIDPETRTIIVPPEYQLFGVENDKRVKRLYFQCPKIVGDNQDLSQNYQLFMNYQNANGDPDAYHIEDMEVDGDNITFSWLLEENVTKYRGNIQFAFGAIIPGDEAEDPDKNRWNTTINTDCTCLVGLKCTQQVAESNPDALVQIWAAIDELKAGGGGTGGTTNYNNLSNKPRLNGVTLEGNKTLDQVGVLAKNQGASNSGKYLSVGSDGNVVPADAPSGGSVDPEQIKQAVNGYLEENPVSGMTAEQEQQLNQNTQDVANLKSALPNKLDTNQGSDNVGKYLIVGDDGNITTLDALIDDGVSLPTGGTTGQVLTKRSDTDKDVVWRSGISGKNEDDNSDYNIVTKIKDGNLTAILEYTSHSPSPGGDDLDVVAINGKTYREIFIDGNKIQWGDFENGNEEFTVQSGTPTLSEEECVSKTHSLKAFGEISQQYRIANAYSHTNSTSVYIALKAKCDRYVKGTLGFNNGGLTVGASDKTNGFETYSAIDTVSGIKTCFVGSISSANLDGYVDDIVVINITEIFGDSVPEKEMLDNAYNNYISIITSDSDNIPSVASIPKTEEYILSSNKHIEYTDTECISAFMDLVNRKAEYYGMANSNFMSPSGAGGNTSCAKDLAIAGYYACGYRDILDVWKHKQYDVKVYGPNEREINVRSTVMNTPIGDYTVYGGKTGSWAGTENLLVVAEANNEVFTCVVMDCGSSQNRFVAMGELLDVISSSSGEVSTALAACAYKIPTQIPQLHNISEETAIYTKNDTQEIIPASVTKVMTAITALDYADSLSEKILFKPSDLESGSGAIFQAGDIITLNDALVAMLLPSSNMAAKAVARNIGKKYLERFGK